VFSIKFVNADGQVMILTRKRQVCILLLLMHIFCAIRFKMLTDENGSVLVLTRWMLFLSFAITLSCQTTVRRDVLWLSLL